jgi:hypothetical protein
MLISEGKKEKKQILTLIKESVMVSPKSMYELARELHSNWDTIRTNVMILKDLGIVSMQDQKIVYVQRSFNINDKYFAGLPVTKNMRIKVYAIAQQFTKEWKKKTNKKINNTVLQKALVEIADAFPKLDIPRGWYLYGRVVLVKLNEELLDEREYTYNFSSEISDVKKLNAKIAELAEHLYKMNTNEVVIEQYNSHNHKMYLVKSEIEKILSTCDIEKNKDILSKYLYELVFLFNLDKKDSFSGEIYGTIKDGITFMIEILKGDKSNLSQYILMDLFRSIWRLLATYNLYTTIEGNLGYDKLVVNNLLIEKANFYKNDFIEQCVTLGI